MSKRTPSKSKGSSSPNSKHKSNHLLQKLRPSKGLIFKLIVVLLVALLSWVIYLDAVVRAKFEGKRWEIPARVYARPLEIYDGLALNAENLQLELKTLGYKKTVKADIPGTFAHHGSGIVIYSRGFLFADGKESARRVAFSIDSGVVNRFFVAKGEQNEILRLEPLQIGGIYPAKKEDRQLVTLDQVPEGLIESLLWVEDRDFERHIGVAPLSIVRAMLANMKAGRVVQGGSTLTQQLVKNFYLSRDKTIIRKATEAMMALLLEFHYEKRDILEAYINEVYLGQAGARAIHGFGMASQFYFGKPLSDLRIEQSALLVALVKGPAYYDPRRHRARALERRNLVLSVLAEEGGISQSEAIKARGRPLGVIDKPSYSTNRYPAFIDLVKRQLASDYQPEDLQSEGLRIFTTLDPQIQERAETSLKSTLASISKKRADSPLEGAVVVTGSESGEVVALVGGAEPKFSGFNRALDAIRPIGSIIKPAVYLTALQQPDRYTLVTPLKDEPFALEFENGERWTPNNFDNKSHGTVPLYQALSKSYNLSTARLGLDLGVDEVSATLRLLGVTRPMNIYPSLFLGATTLAPIDVTQMYQTIAASGFNVPVRAIRSVTTSSGEELSRYAYEVDQVIDSNSMHLLQYGLIGVAKEGTARGVYRYLNADLTVAGKTGTTNDSRDSWFAGFSGDYLGVVWLGHDDNRSTGLTGSSGALKVWGQLMKQFPQRPFDPIKPSGINYRWIDESTGNLTQDGCTGARFVPFIVGSEPVESQSCTGGFSRARHWFNSLFN
ncbi:penicillin-binding protein 1B [Alkalimarinus alittae]|uniref:Penicillin-binding protein 1B n=1 Tax=Alkalimarinus alittae TaxID=2961619 RepID=A0ABY6N1A2_9ALTE|nr:penicillin-binding protein 1B [Alkalimarinus alittae]UZE95864.1 penicillin-binding protein 1B [Alkalimarinus alittae]